MRQAERFTSLAEQCSDPKTTSPAGRHQKPPGRALCTRFGALAVLHQTHEPPQALYVIRG